MQILMMIGNIFAVYPFKKCKLFKKGCELSSKN